MLWASNLKSKKKKHHEKRINVGGGGKVKIELKVSNLNGVPVEEMLGIRSQGEAKETEQIAGNPSGAGLDFKAGYSINHLVYSIIAPILEKFALTNGRNVVLRCEKERSPPPMEREAGGTEGAVTSKLAALVWCIRALTLLHVWRICQAEASQQNNLDEDDDNEESEIIMQLVLEKAPNYISYAYETNTYFAGDLLSTMAYGMNICDEKAPVLQWEGNAWKQCLFGSKGYGGKQWRWEGIRIYNNWEKLANGWNTMISMDRNQERWLSSHSVIVGCINYGLENGGAATDGGHEIGEDVVVYGTDLCERIGQSSFSQVLS
ncbi:hypothetical protein DFH27DRAFT_610846 [Peziza echinospora]|nr:hypothetical protein DFH27DRAFT_610846 [Peziza echinospora]